MSHLVPVSNIKWATPGMGAKSMHYKLPGNVETLKRSLAVFGLEAFRDEATCIDTPI